MAWKKDEDYLRRTIELSAETDRKREGGAFASLLVDENGQVVLEQPNIDAVLGDVTAHDTITLVREAVKKHDAAYLNKCTLYAICEPCVMCTAACFWAGIHRIKYAMSEEDLAALLPGGLSISSQEFCRRAPVEMSSDGPNPALREEAIAVVKRWTDRILGN